MFIIACISSAVGLGNIWRLPYTAGMNGGGSFLLLYFLAVILIGIPLLLVELTVGKTIRENATGAFRKMLGKFWWLVFFPLGLTLLVLSYYLVVTGWTMFYAVSSLFGLFIPFDDAIKSWFLPIGGLLSLLIAEIVSRNNLKNGLEKINLALFPVFLLALIFLFFNSLSLPGMAQSISALTTIDPAYILNPSTMIAAISQALFSLSIGFAAMLTYGSYARKKDELLGSSLIVAATDTAVGVLSALMIFSIAFSFGIPISSGPELAFESLPQAFLAMPYGILFMFIFFLLLFSVAITSVVSMSEVLVDNLRKREEPRGKAALIMLALCLVLFIPSALSYSPLPTKILGTPVLDFLDAEIVGRFAALMVLSSVFAFTWGWKDCKKALSKNLPAPLVEPVFFLVKYVAPVAIISLQLATFL